MKSVLVTGANGFLGCYLCRHFSARGWSVAGIDASAPSQTLLNSLSQYGQWSLPSPRLGPLLQEFRPELILHCAGRALPVESFRSPAADYAAGPALTFEVLDQVRQFAPRARFVLLSSAAVYGQPKSLPVDEGHPVCPLTPYGYHKWQSEQICTEFSRMFGVATVALRIFSAYGPGLKRQVVWDICRKIDQQPELLLYGTGGESRDFIHAQDVAAAVQLVAWEAPGEADVYNVASGVETSIRELAERLAVRLRSHRPPSFDGTLPVGTPRNWRADVGKLAALGFRPAISLEQGLGEVVDWYRRETETSCRRSA